MTLPGRAADGAPAWRPAPRRSVLRPTAARVALEPRKLPQQARARATFEAIVDACGQMLASGPYEALTTNCISERAGVSIGTLYEYFPNRESIVAALAAQSCARLVARMKDAILETAGMSQLQGAEHLLMAGVEALGSPENAFKVMLREAPFVTTLPAMTEARAALTALCQDIRACTQDTLNLPTPEADAWLISQMLFGAMLEIAFLDADPAERRRLCADLAILTCRMALGHDAAEGPAARH